MQQVLLSQIVDAAWYMPTITLWKKKQGVNCKHDIIEYIREKTKTILALLLTFYVNLTNDNYINACMILPLFGFSVMFLDGISNLLKLIVVTFRNARKTRAWIEFLVAKRTVPMKSSTLWMRVTLWKRSNTGLLPGFVGDLSKKGRRIGSKKMWKWK